VASKATAKVEIKPKAKKVSNGDIGYPNFLENRKLDCWQKGGAGE